MPESRSITDYAQSFYAFLAVLAGATLIARVGITVFDQDHPELGVRLMRLFSFFTIQSNIVVMLVAGLLAAIAPARRALRITPIAALRDA